MAGSGLLLGTLSVWLTPVWLISLGIAAGLAILAVLYGIATLVAPRVADFVLMSLREGILFPLTMVAAFDAFNFLNRANYDEVTSVYGSPVFCGGVPQHYSDGLTRSIQSGSPSVACPAGPIAVPGGTLPPTPIGTNLFIPTAPNTNFGVPRTAFNPRQLQFSAKFNF